MALWSSDQKSYEVHLMQLKSSCGLWNLWFMTNLEHNTIVIKINK